MKKGSNEYYQLAGAVANFIEAYATPDSRGGLLEVPDLEFINEMLDKEIDRNLHPEPCNME